MVVSLLVAAVFVLVIGPGAFAMPFLAIAGRVVNIERAKTMAKRQDLVVTYNEGISFVQRVWLSHKRPISGIVSGFRGGYVVWMPFADMAAVQNVFGDRVVKAGRNDGWELIQDDGRTLFDVYWEERRVERNRESHLAVDSSEMPMS